MTLPHPVAFALTVLSWLAVFICLAMYGAVWLVAAALRLVVGTR